MIARLDRLGSAKDIVLTASVIGREFSYELIEAVTSAPPAKLLADLGLLVQSDLLEQRGSPPQSRYIFKHALILDAAFQSVLKAKRRELHQRIAEVFASRFPEVVATEPELLAYHYAEANLVDRALACWRQAADRAVARLAYVEALGHVDKAMKLIAGMPEGTNGMSGSLVSWSLKGHRGWHWTVGIVRRRNASMRRHARSPKGWDVQPKCSGQSGVYGWERIAAASTFAPTTLYREVFELLKQTNDPEYVVQAHHAGGSQMVAEGVPRVALAHVDQLMTNYRMDVHGNLALMYGAHDPACCSLGMRALSLAMLGYLDQALEESDKALELSERLGHKPSISHTHMFRAELSIILNCLKTRRNI